MVPVPCRVGRKEWVSLQCVEATGAPALLLPISYRGESRFEVIVLRRPSQRSVRPAPLTQDSQPLARASPTADGSAGCGVDTEGRSAQDPDVAWVEAAVRATLLQEWDKVEMCLMTLVL